MKKTTIYQLLIVTSLILGFNGSVLAQSTAISPELGPYHSRVKNTYEVLNLLVEQPGALQAEQMRTLQQLQKRLQTARTNIDQEEEQRPYLRHLERPMDEMLRYITAAEKQLDAGNEKAARKSINQAHRIATVLYKKPVVQMIMAEQKINTGTSYMIDKEYEKAVAVFDDAINVIAAIPVKANSPYKEELAAVKQQVLSLRRQAREKTIKTPSEKFLRDIGDAFKTAHADTTFGLWSGGMSMQKLRN